MCATSIFVCGLVYTSSKFCRARCPLKKCVRAEPAPDTTKQCIALSRWRDSELCTRTSRRTHTCWFTSCTDLEALSFLPSTNGATAPRTRRLALCRTMARCLKNIHGHDGMRRGELLRYGQLVVRGQDAAIDAHNIRSWHQTAPPRDSCRSQVWNI